MAVTNICDYSAVVEYGFVPVFCPIQSIAIGWNIGSGGNLCTISSNGEPLSLYLLSCFNIDYLYKFTFDFLDVTQGSAEIKINGNLIDTITSPGVYDYQLTGLTGTVVVEIIPNNFDGCFNFQVYSAVTQTNDYPILTGISINGEFQTLDTPITFDPSLTDIKDYFQTLGNVNILQGEFYTHIHFSQTEDVIDYIVIEFNSQEYQIKFEKFNCPDFPYEKWQCCLASLIEQLYKSEKYQIHNIKDILKKIKYLTNGIKILQNKDSNCLSDSEMKTINDNLNSLCCSPCPPDNQIVKYINNPPPNINRCDSVPSVILRTQDSDGQICSGNSVVLYIDTSVFYTGYVYEWQQSTDDGLTWVKAEGNQISPIIPVFYSDPITTPIIYRLVVNCEYSTDPPQISNEISFSIMPNPVVSVIDLFNNLPTCSYDSLILSCTDLGLGSTYYWTGPNGFTSTSRTPLVDLSTYGAGLYQVQATNSSGCTSFASFEILPEDIIPEPEIDYVITEDSGVGDGTLTVTITNEDCSDINPNLFNLIGITDPGFNDINTDGNFINLPAGFYTLQVTSGCNCELNSGSGIEIEIPLI